MKASKLIKMIKDIASERLERNLTDANAREVIDLLYDYLGLELEELDDYDQEELAEELEHILCTEAKDIGEPGVYEDDPYGDGYDEQAVVLKEDSFFDDEDDLEE